MRWLAMLTLAAGLAVVAGFGSGSRPRIPSARFEGAGASCPRPAGFMPRVVPAKGRPGSAITLTG
ncbi:MAG: hypothetical protein ACTHNU_04945, partial [Gaiellales bacterium]